jgi:GH25 family lysozyme M1 (1,4-beta-N-acetylmuramidase)
MTPIEASKKENESTVKEKLNKKVTKYTSELPKFKIGDKVRIYSYKNTFDKGYKKNYTDEVFIISAVHNTVPWTYSISDSTGEEIKGKFYSMEMIHSDFDFDNKLQKNKLYNL